MGIAIEKSLKQEKPSGGFSLDDSSDTADVDLTAMTLQCLEPYATEEEISAIIDRGVEFLADAQAEDGGYEAYGDKSSESIERLRQIQSAGSCFGGS